MAVKPGRATASPRSGPVEFGVSVPARKLRQRRATGNDSRAIQGQRFRFVVSGMRIRRRIRRSPSRGTAVRQEDQDQRESQCIATDQTIFARPEQAVRRFGQS